MVQGYLYYIMALWKQINGDWDTIEREGAPFDLLHSKPCLGVTQSPHLYPLVKYHVLAIIFGQGKIDASITSGCIVPLVVA